MNNNVDTTNIKKFLDGFDDEKYIVGIEASYSENSVVLLIDDPEKGKYMKRVKFKPFTFCKDFKSLNVPFYPSPDDRTKSMKRHSINITKLRTDGEYRLENGFKYVVHSEGSVGNLMQFFRGAGYNLYGDASADINIPKSLFITQQPAEMMLIQSGKRLFKGYEKYSEIHKFYFDLETTGLDPKTSSIFLIGMKDNRGFEEVIEIDESDPESEKNAIILFFKVLMELKPTIVAGYNSEAFDFDFIIERAKIHGIDLGSQQDDYSYKSDIPTSLNKEKPLRRKRSTIKFGNEMEYYVQTIMWGFNVIDISHAVRKAMAINSDIKSWGLKYICKYAKVAKKNRMYIDGDKIYKIFKENLDYYYNPENSGYILNNGQERLEGFIENISGKEIVRKYLLDDLYETEQVDEVFNQQAFMMGKLVPTTFSRVSTMGTAALWKLLMVAYSYENKIALPKIQHKTDFVGGLSRLFRVGYSRNILKMDFASLYPSIQLTHDVFPKCDITGALKQMLTYFRDARNEYKKLAKKEKDAGNQELAKLYDTKQLPVKILNNSLFGALSAPDVFPWGDMDCGERITCTGRQYLRRMVKFFMDYGYKPLVLDTDGVNLIIPEDADKVEYKGKKGYLAVLEMFNETMTGVMKLDEDGIWEASINMARKNYANLDDEGKVKLVGNTIKSKKLQTYMEKFIDIGVKLLLDGDGKGFVEFYYEYLAKIYNKQVPLIEIANKGKVKITADGYKEHLKKTNKNGKALPKQAHMELVLEHNLNPSLGEVLYYVNNGKKKSDGDTGNSYLIYEKDFEMNPNLLGEYNTARYISIFNKRIEPLLICFKPEVRDVLLVDNPEKRQFFTSTQLELVNGVPFEIGDQDCINIEEYSQEHHENEPLFEMSENEIKFWNRTMLNPYDIFNNFTTEISLTKLQIVDNKKEAEKIKNVFKQQSIDVKFGTDIVKDGDFVINKIDNVWYLNEMKNGNLNRLEDLTEYL